jgi:hypothetical protein
MPVLSASTTCDTVCFTILSLSTIGAVSVFLAFSVYFVWTLEVTQYDTNVLVWLFVALGISVSVLFIAFYLNCCYWRFTKILLAVLYTIFDLILLCASVAVLSFRSQVLDTIGALWSDNVDSSIERYFEKKLNCCGFREQLPEYNCQPDMPICYDVLEEDLKRYSWWIGGILIGLTVILMVGVGIAYFRACAKPPTPDDIVKSQEMAQIQAQLTEDSSIWF